MEMFMTVMLALSIGGSIVGLMIYYGYKAIDTAFLNYQPTKAKLISKIFKSAHSQTYLQMLPVAKTTIMVPLKNKYPDSYAFVLEVDGISGVMQVSEKSYNKFVEGQEVSVKCAKNRLKNKLSFK